MGYSSLIEYPIVIVFWDDCAYAEKCHQTDHDATVMTALIFNRWTVFVVWS